MKLRNKKTGAIYKIEDIDLGNNADGIWLGMTQYNSLAELNEDWEDYEEPSEIYFISNNGQIHEEAGHDRYREERKAIGNYFETKEEAEKAVSKLKAWKRLKDKGFRFNGWNGTRVGSNISYISEVYYKGCIDDMDLLFGGEE